MDGARAILEEPDATTERRWHQVDVDLVEKPEPLRWGGPPAAVVDAALRGRIQPVTSQELLDELRRVLEYPRLSSVLRTAGLSAAEMVALVADASVVVVPLREAVRARGPDDDRVLEAAAAGSVDVIISGDADLLSRREVNGMPILSASEFIARMLRET